MSEELQQKLRDQLWEVLGVVTEDDLNIYNKPDRRTQKGKFLSHFLEEQGLVRNGYYFSTLAKEINEQDFGIIATRKCRQDTNDIIDIIADTLDEEMPVIISTDFPDGGHAMLAVGYETNNEEDAITKILCLDPIFHRGTASLMLHINTASLNIHLTT